MNRSVLALAQIGLDRALNLDPEASAIIAPLAGKRIEVQITDTIPMRIMVSFIHDRVILGHGALRPREEAGGSIRDDGADEDGAPDVCVTGSLSSLVMLARGNSELPSTTRVSVRGDIALLQLARTSLARLRPDFDEPLARLLGDEIAWPVSRMMRRVAASVQRTVAEIGEDVKEYIGEESQTLAAPDAVEDFCNDVDQLRDALARLDKRVERVADRLGAHDPVGGAMRKS